MQRILEKNFLSKATHSEEPQSVAYELQRKCTWKSKLNVHSKVTFRYRLGKGREGSP